MIGRRQRTRILILEGGVLAHELANEIRSQHTITVLDESDECLVMIKNRETARNTSFYLGEVLVTEAKVLLNEVTGLGLIQGHSSEKALDLAVIDAAYQAQLPNVHTWDHKLLSAEKLIEEKRREEDLNILASRVEFESMDRESE